MIGNTIAGPAKALVNFESSTNDMFGGSPTIIRGFEVPFDGWLFLIILAFMFSVAKFALLLDQLPCSLATYWQLLDERKTITFYS